MAGCARSRFGQLIAFAVSLLAGAAFAQSPSDAGTSTPTTATRAAAAPPRAQAARRGTQGPSNAKSPAPDAALIEYLGEFGDAADGLDAMGLAETDADEKRDDGKQGGKR